MTRLNLSMGAFFALVLFAFCNQNNAWAGGGSISGGIGGSIPAATSGTLDYFFGMNSPWYSPSAGIFVPIDVGFESITLVQPDGKFLLFRDRQSDWSSGKLTVYRLTQDGLLDSSFGTAGVAQIDLPAGPGSYNFVSHAAALPSGKITVHIWERDPYWDTVMSLNANGTLNTAFGNAATPGYSRNFLNITDEDVSIELTDMSVQPSTGNIFFGGYSDVYHANIDDYIDNFAIAKLTSQGILDTSYASGSSLGSGIKLVSFGGPAESVMKLKIQANGKAVALGYSMTANYDTRFAMTRLNANGSLDTTLAGDGKILIKPTEADSFDEDTLMLHAQDNGKILISYEHEIPDPDYDPADEMTITSQALVRYNANGSTDNSFASGGYYEFALTEDGSLDAFTSRVVGSEERVVFAGYNEDQYPTLTGLTNAGSYDNSFGSSGGKTINLDFPHSSDQFIFVESLLKDGAGNFYFNSRLSGSNGPDYTWIKKFNK